MQKKTNKCLFIFGLLTTMGLNGLALASHNNNEEIRLVVAPHHTFHAYSHHLKNYPEQTESGRERLGRRGSLENKENSKEKDDENEQK